ncbi:uncharacterized protein [Amphiura filiformis]|uniref:uncharacterized protein n=1 Tax=Amphiura filiformis TaxID=82378 RepID=UPI003B21C33D
MYDNGFSDRLIRATQPTAKKNRETRQKELQNVYEKCRRNIQCSFGEYIRSKISRDTLRKCGISNIDLRYIELSSDSQLYHGGTTWECGKSYLFTGSIDRLSTACSESAQRNKEDEMGVDCVRLFQLDRDRHLLAVNRNAIEELCREWYNDAQPPEEEEESPPSEPPQMETPVITINGHGTNGNVEEENKESVSKENEKKENGAKEEADTKEVNGVTNDSNKKEENGKKEEANGKDNKIAEAHQKIVENGSPAKEQKEKEPKSTECPDLFVRRDGIALVDVCFQNERETEFYNVEGIAYEDASSGSSKDILLYHTSATSSISSKDILLFDTTELRLKQELIVPRRSTKHLVRGQNGYLRCNEPARPRAPPSVRARPVSASRVSENGTKSWSAEASTRDTKL